MKWYIVGLPGPPWTLLKKVLLSGKCNGISWVYQDHLGPSWERLKASRESLGGLSGSRVTVRHGACGAPRTLDIVITVEVPT
eukprot:4823462-Pyramimonas_sp.AAC.1